MGEMQGEANGASYVYCDMADHSRVVWQPDVACLVMRRTDSSIVAAVLRGCCSVRVNNEGAGDIDLDASRACDCIVDFFGRCHGPRPLGYALLLVVVGLVLIMPLSLQLVIKTVVWRGSRGGLLGRNEGRHCRFFLCLFLSALEG